MTLALPVFRGFVQELYEFVDHKDFWSMRLVCKSWRNLSMENQSHWYHWLTIHGKLAGYDMHGHNQPWCPNGERCRVPSHHDRVQRVPLILRTVPISKQALRQAIAAKRRRLNGFLHLAITKKENSERQLVRARSEVEEASEHLAQLERVAEQYPVKRRRQHIRLNISKVDEN